jgi:hypothetical protein
MLGLGDEELDELKHIVVGLLVPEFVADVVELGEEVLEGELAVLAEDFVDQELLFVCF